MSAWIEQSVELISLLASQLLSTPFIYLVVLFILVIICRLFKRLGG